ncbi:hypothetical protein C0Z20_26465 [Trinickia symbiotica]|uniref:Uncharacterized protein n=2 Tax=Trinickia symbiotica TaxID=863227 RepID=A0A2N7WRV9_9BURK|nr:hypothetical protein C0Z20_26465 [Trinickia symbiotica]
MFSSMTTALANLSAMLNAFKSVPPNATVAEMLGATTLKEKLDVVGAMAASYYVGAVLGSILVGAQASKACSDPYRSNLTVQRYRFLGLVDESRSHHPHRCSDLRSEQS